MQATIQYIKRELAQSYPETEIQGFVRIIFETVLELSYTDIILQNDRKLNTKEFETIKNIVTRLKTNEPIQYILGECEFYGLKLNVNSAVLIPRQETEELVHWVVQSNVKSGPNILDVGTGSGCIALALKKELDDAIVSAVEISEEALQVAKSNGAKNKINVDFYQADIIGWENYAWNKYDVIVSNPPYVRNCEKKLMESNVLEYEPEGALFVEDDNPLIFYATIAEFAMKNLVEGGYLFFEINEYLGAEMKLLLKSLGFSAIEVKKDINGKDRMLVCQKRENNLSANK